MNEVAVVGDVVTKTKHIEYTTNCIISNFLGCHNLSPDKVAFFTNVVLNSSVINLGAKIKIIKTICNTLDINGQDYDIGDLHALLKYRNLFAHESDYMEDSEQWTSVMDLLESSGQYKTKTMETWYKKFLDYYAKVDKNITLLNERIAKLSEKK